MLHDNYFVNEKGHFAVGGVDTVELVKKYGTPLYVLDENKVRENVGIYNRAMKKYFTENSKIHYASKALSVKALYRVLAQEGASIDVVSLGELYTAKAAGFNLENAALHGNNKTDYDLQTALDENVGEIVVDSFEELDILDILAKKAGKKQKIMLRITPNIDCHTLKAVSTGQLDSKFGTPIETGQAMKLVVQALQKEGVELVGFHCHCGSQVFEVQPFIEQARVMFDFMYDVKVKTGYEAKVMDIGGGFGVRYTESDPQVDIEDNIRQISEEIKRICAQKDLKMPDILMEPGRSIVAAAGVTLYTVGSVKEIEGYRTYVAVDGGMTDNPRYALYKSRYEVLIANKADKPKDLICTVAGRCCESGDMIGEEMQLQTPVRGDILATLVTGAYNYSMASNYNRIPRPAMVFVNNGSEYLAVKRESFEQLYENDI